VVRCLAKASRLAARAGLAYVVDDTLSLRLDLLSSNQLVFVNVDHAPMGVCSTMSYG
jgi:hypothetical protein